MMKIIKSLSALVFCAATLAACTAQDNVNAVPSNDETIGQNMIALSPLWTAGGFDAPESVQPISNTQGFYVSNVNGEGTEKNGKGYISRISSTGDLVELQWVTGLDAPKGMAVSGKNLYVSDIDQLIVIDQSSGTISNRVKIPGAEFLNDVAALDTGEILVSDSANARIYAVSGTDVSVWFESETLDGVNGLLVDENRLLVTTMSAGHLLSVDLDTQSIDILASEMSNADGIVILNDGSFVVSSWPGKLYHILKDGRVENLLDTTDTPIYMNDIYLQDNRLLIPNWVPGTLTSYSIETTE